MYPQTGTHTHTYPAHSFEWLLIIPDAYSYPAVSPSDSPMNTTVNGAAALSTLNIECDNFRSINILYHLSSTGLWDGEGPIECEFHLLMRLWSHWRITLVFYQSEISCCRQSTSPPLRLFLPGVTFLFSAVYSTCFLKIFLFSQYHYDCFFNPLIAFFF